jgi:glycerophosphoryl diester phosphodiesterase
MTSDQLREVDAGSGAYVPTLAEVLERFATTPMIVEIKERAVTPAVLALLRKLDAIDRVLLGAFDHAVLAPARTGEFHLSASRRETARVWAAARLAISTGGRFDGFTVPERQGSLRVVDAKFLRATGRSGKPVHVWTVDSVEDASRLRAMGVAGIITNFPGSLRNI